MASHLMGCQYCCVGQPNPVAVLDKAVAILRAVADEPATLADLVARTRLPRATAHRLAGAPDGPGCPGTGWRWPSRDTGWCGAPTPAPGRPDRPWPSWPAAGPTWPTWPSGTWSRCATSAGKARSFTSGTRRRSSASREAPTRAWLAALEGNDAAPTEIPALALLPMAAGSGAHGVLAFAP